ncbi:MAG: hypothetical protein ABI036_04570 [Fibrobacteria bacterium]
MGDPVVWLGGWASDLVCWRESLQRLYPRREHSFLDCHAVLEDPGLLARTAEGLGQGGTLVAWSMGSLVVHRALAEEGWNPPCRLASASPIFAFCGEDGKSGAWPRAALMRMARRMPREKDAVLAEFWDLCRGISQVTQEQESRWLDQARGYSLSALLGGLEFLGSVTVDIAALPSAGRLLFLASPLDPLAPMPRGGFPGREWIGYARGHLPFLDHPGLLAPWLDGRSTGGEGEP